ncbi:MAG: chromate transporter [Glomeribacter sp. 1016415]|nr:chromate transporter [Glomeribacter sp. 1016415]
MFRQSTPSRNPSPVGPVTPLPPLQEEASTIPHEPLWSMFLTIFKLSGLSWGGLALMALLENHYVERKGALTRPQYSDLVALAWLMPGPVSCNVAVQLGYALRGGRGAWIAGIASVLPFSVVMTLFAIFYQSPTITLLTPHTLLAHFSVVLAMLIGVTWFKQTRALLRRPLDWVTTIVASVALLSMHSPIMYVILLGGAFALGWFTGPKNNEYALLRLALTRTHSFMLAVIVLLIVFFSIPIPASSELTLLWPRLAGAGLTLFGGGFSALPVLKTLLTTPAIGIADDEFTLAFALSPISPGPLLNVVPFLGYLVGQLPGAFIATFALFTPPACLIVIAQQHLKMLKMYSRFEHAMQLVRAATSAFFIVAIVKIASRVPLEPVYALTGIFALLCFTRFKMPVYAVYGTVFLVFFASLWW